MGADKGPLWWGFTMIIGYIVLFLASVWAIYSPRVDDGIVGRLAYSMAALAAFTGIFSKEENNANIALVVALIVIIIRYLAMKAYTEWRQSHEHQ